MDSPTHPAVMAEVGSKPPIVPAGLKWAAAVIIVLVAGIALFLALFDWDMLRGPVSRYASVRMGRTVRIEGHLRAHLLTWTPEFTAYGVRVGEPAWLGTRGTKKGDMTDIDRLAVAVKLRSLLIGRFTLASLEIDRPEVFMLREASGRDNWTFGRKTDKPAGLPPIQRFTIRDGHLTIVDAKRKLTFTGTINASEQRLAANRRGFRMDGVGTVNRKPFVMVATGGPLLDVRPNRPYPFDADMRAGDTHVTAKGVIPKPFNFGLLDADLNLSGPNLADLYFLTGLALPSTPPYRMAGHLNRDGTLYRFTKAAGRVGGSDLEGDLSVQTAGGRANATADFRSRLLDFKDMATLLGALLHGQWGRGAEPSGRMLPDAPLYTGRLRSMDAKVTYRALAVKPAPHMPLRNVFVDLTLDHGVLTLHPLTFGFPQGKLTAQVKLDGRTDTPQTDLDARLTDISLEPFFPAKGGAAPLEGILQARAKLHGSGDTVHKAAATSDGAITLVIPKGAIRQTFAELLGINVTKGLFLLLSKDQSDTDIRCAVADFRVKNGVLTADRIIADTGVTVIKGAGTVNLGSETLDLRLQGAPKQFRLVRLKAPITVQGPIRSPHFGVDADDAFGQAGIAVALGAVLTPLAAVLPFVDPGLAKNTDCAALFAQAKASAAPPAKTTAPKHVVRH